MAIESLVIIINTPERKRGAHPLYRSEPARHDECQFKQDEGFTALTALPSADTEPTTKNTLKQNPSAE